MRYSRCRWNQEIGLGTIAQINTNHACYSWKGLQVKEYQLGERWDSQWCRYAETRRSPPQIHNTRPTVLRIRWCQDRWLLRIQRTILKLSLDYVPILSVLLVRVGGGLMTVSHRPRWKAPAFLKPITSIWISISTCLLPTHTLTHFHTSLPNLVSLCT